MQNMKLMPSCNLDSPGVRNHIHCDDLFNKTHTHTVKSRPNTPLIQTEQF